MIPGHRSTFVSYSFPLLAYWLLVYFLSKFTLFIVIFVRSLFTHQHMSMMAFVFSSTLILHFCFISTFYSLFTHQHMSLMACVLFSSLILHFCLISILRSLLLFTFRLIFVFSNLNTQEHFSFQCFLTQSTFLKLISTPHRSNQCHT